MTILETIDTGSDVYRVVHRPFFGLRVLHGEFVEWPVVVPDGHGKPALRFAVYEFNGEKSSPKPNETVPEEVRKAVQRHLRG